MGVEIKLTDKEFPVSAAFIEFLHRHINEQRTETSWHDQLSEVLVPADAEKKREVAQAVAESVMQDAAGQKAIYRSYELLTAILTGVPDRLRFLRERYRFICVVGCPRHGGSYLVKQLFLAIGIDPDTVPNVIAHDGFPDASPFEFKDQHNSLTTMIQNMAEYLAMVEVFFANSRLFDNRVVVPKKATKAAYQGGFFAAVLGPDTEYVITLRHPVAACISTYEKSTGFPEDGRFRVRGNIEEWAWRDNIFTGEDPEAIFRRDYFDVYLRYWEQYHCNLALTGLGASRNWSVVAYGRERMMQIAQKYYTRFRSKTAPEAFKEFDYRGRHPDWERKAEQAVRRVAALWRGVGREFPVDEIMECR